MARDAGHATLGIISFGHAIGITSGLAVSMLAIMAALVGGGGVLAAILQNLYLDWRRILSAQSPAEYEASSTAL